MPPPPAETRAIRAGKWLLAALVPASALALGSLPNEVLVLMSAAAALACGLLWYEHDVRTSRASRFVLLALVLLVGWTILQAVPLPAGLVRVLAPANADIWDRALSPLREPGPAWHSLSVAPGATRVEVLRGFFYGCVLLAALRVASLENGERFLVRLVVFSSVLMAVAALAHTAFGAEKVFGVYRPRELYAYPAGRFSPLLNKNHLAAYLDVGACVATAALVSGRSMPRALSASAALVLAATSVWQGSRGGFAALALGTVVAVSLTLYAKRRFASARAEVAILAVCTAAAAFMISLALSDVARDRLMSRELTKVYVAKSSLHLILASPWFGVGRGGFETVFSSVREGSSYVTFTHPENGIIQWFVEWGVPVSLVGMALLGWALRPQLLLRAVRPAVGAWVAVVVTVFHDLVDFHLEVPGVVALVVLCVAITVSGRSSSRESSSLRPRWLPSRRAALALAGGSVVAIALAWPEVDHSLAAERRLLGAMAADKSVSPEQFREGARAAMLRYPSEPFFPLMVAVRAQLTGEGSVMPGVARALERSPRFGRAHFVLARSLGARRAAQARLEYRLAFENDEELRYQIVKEGMRLVEDADSALEMVPEGDSGVEMLQAMVEALAERLPSTAVILDAEIERRSPTATGPLRRRAQAAISDATDGAAWCARRACITEGLAISATLIAREPSKCQPHVLVARLRAANGEAPSAVDGLEKAVETVVDRAECQRELISLALSTGQTRRGDMALDKLVRGGCGAASECTDLYSWAAGMEESRGHYARAVRLYKRVLEIAPDRDDLLQHIGEMGDKSGLRADAVEAYGILQTRHPDDPRWAARIGALRSGALPAPSVFAPPSDLAP
jgi:tetratricopeptide (TPR) repeat protein